MANSNLEDPLLTRRSDAVRVYSVKQEELRYTTTFSQLKSL